MTTEKNKALTETTDEKPKESFKLVIWLSFGFIVTFVLGYLGFLVYVSWPISEWSVSKAASLGDSFGILSSLFSGLAFAGLIVTIVMQNKTLKLQMEELREARVVSELQKNAIVGQEKVMNSQFESIQLQKFESTFFKMIDNHRHIISSNQLKLDDVNGKLVNGFDYIRNKYKNDLSMSSFLTDERGVNKSFYKIYYCGFIRIFSFIFKNEGLLKKNKSKSFYIDIFKDYLSIEDFNCLVLLSFKYSEEEKVKVFYDPVFIEKGFFNEIELDSFFSSLKKEILNFDSEFLESRLHNFFKFLYSLCVDEKSIYNESFEKLLKKLSNECSFSISSFKDELIEFKKYLNFFQEESEKVLSFSECGLDENEFTIFKDCVEKNISFSFIDDFSFSESQFKRDPVKLANYFGFLKGKIEVYSALIKKNESHIHLKTTMFKEFNNISELIPLTPPES